MPIDIGDRVKIHYTVKLENGEVVDSTRDREPLSLRVGSEEVLPAIQESLIGLTKGDEKTITIPPSKGFGERREDLVQEVPKSRFGGRLEASAGDLVELRFKDGGLRLCRVDEVREDSVLLDLNHPLAGETLVYDIEIVDVGSR